MLEEPYLSELKAGRIPQEQIDELERQRNNVVREYRFVLEVIKR